MLALLLAALADPVSYSREVAPVLAFHCNHCHAAPPGTASGGLNTATYQGLVEGGGMGRALVPGDSGKSLLMEFIDGRRAKRMPLNAAPLSHEQIGIIARWISEGANRDEDRAPKSELTARFSPRPGRSFTIVCRVPTRAYLRLVVTGNRGEILHREDTALPAGGEARWPLIAGKRWPRQAIARVQIAFTEHEPAGAHIHVE